ncbi:MAG: hypothetical protein CVT72_11475 [Alphaproteobacteria bacterium HGW-Alphaproteobacteria-11]|nr:MAG: hypothetical protein CVT72_11475 [Alphaproteobacteria bacterium HGW-Alphaproteobacteria-11]
MIVFCHLLNDNSGSPRVLRSVIAALAGGRGENLLMVGSQGRGVLEDSEIEVRRYWYRRSRFRLVTLFTYFSSQVALYRALARARDIPRGAVIYVNTLLPFGAALWGKATGRRVIYHLHEVSVTPPLLRRFLTWIAARTAKRLIYVSEDHRARLPIAGVPAAVVPNPIDPAISARAASSAHERKEGFFHVLMLASPRDFKGVPEYLELARDFAARPGFAFTLVLNGTPEEVGAYLGEDLPDNLDVHARTDHPADFIVRADLLVNLSRVDQWIETFGLTLIEAMAFGLPVIAPPVGGPTEIVRHGREGWLIDSRDRAALAEVVLRTADDRALYEEMSRAARVRAADFGFDRFAKALREVVSSVAVEVDNR